ncbi:MAG: VWA domain-containing protein [Gammaproteobacteria bacterium]
MNNKLLIYSVLAIQVGVFSVACSPHKEQDISQTENPIEQQNGKKDQRPQVSRLVKEEEKIIASATAPVPQPGVQSRLPVTSKMAKQQFAHGYIAPNAVVTQDTIRQAYEPLDRENYAHIDDNPIKRTVEHPVSTFSIDVDTGSYSNVRRMLSGGSLPRRDAVRVEEMINYFNYQYPVPGNEKIPFSITTEMAPSPWNNQQYLLQVGLKGYDIDRTNLPAANLVFLIDVSGSMTSANKLPLLKSSMKLLTNKLRARDKISIVVYAGSSGVVLNPTPGNHKAQIIASLDRLQAGGSTNGAAGIRLAYNLAQQAFVKGGINRVILATDGDFNVGTTNFEALKDLIEEKRKTGITLTTLGFGNGNYNDYLMEQLADKGNGNYAYIDTLNEARKVLVEEMSSTLKTIAKDVKIQIEFNPKAVAEYRLIGYENRALKREDFNNDKIDAGDIGAGHTVTALYEISLTGSQSQRIDPLRYSNKPEVSAHKVNEIGFLKLRYKNPGTSISKLTTQVITRKDILDDINKATDNLRFSSAVAAFGQLLRGGKYTGQFAYRDVLKLAQTARGKDMFGYRGEFINLVNMADTLSSNVMSQQ